MTGQSGIRVIHFGAAQRPIFGVAHLPGGTWSGRRVVLCPPLGFEGLFATTTFAHVAAHLAEHVGALTLCVDYDGTGDSSGVDRDPGRVSAWIDSIHAAITWLEANAPSRSPVAVVGLRAGALLAAAACAERSQQTALGLWAPTPTGRAFVREQRAFNAMASAPSEVGSEGVSRAFEANGYFYSDETVADLEKLSLARSVDAPPAHLLLLLRSDLPMANVIPKHWREANADCAITETQTTDYVGLMQSPWLWEEPVESTAVLLRWVGQLPGDESATLVREPSTSPARVANGVVESAVRVGSRGLLAILTTPTAGTSRGLAVLVTSTFGYRIGPNRLNVEMARRLATYGVASLRIDVRGVGSHRDTSGEPPPTPYDGSLTDDVLDAVQWARDAGHLHLALHGVCAGAFHAWRAAMLSETPVRLVLANLETFWPIEYDRAAHNRYMIPKRSLSIRIRDESRIVPLLRLGIEAGRKVLARAREYAGGSLPSRLYPSGLPAQIDALARRGSTTRFIYSGGDDGIAHYRRFSGINRPLLEARGTVTLEVIDGPDHSFTSYRSRDQLIDAVAADLDRWLLGRSRE